MTATVTSKRAVFRTIAEHPDYHWPYYRLPETEYTAADLGALEHDLRRTWGTLLVESGVEPGMIMEWGGWDDWETFREHYLGAYSAEMQRQQLDKVD